MTGSPVGENVFQSADGNLSSKTTMDMGSIKILSTVVAHTKNGRLIDAAAETSSPGGSSKVSFSKGLVSVDAGGRHAEAPWQDKTGLWAANLHPQFFAPTLIAAEKSAADKPAAKAVPLSAYFVDGGVVLPVSITVQKPAMIDVKGKRVAARKFSLELSGIRIEFVMDEASHVVAEDIPVQHVRFVADGWEGAFVDPIAKFPELSQATYKTKTERGVHVRMRDNVELVCDITRPDDEEKHPAILVRTPYGRGAEAVGGEFYASRGYAYVVQDCRGREDSYGTWDPFVTEGPDGYDTIEWVAAQPWCTGKVGMIGGSYAGYVQWAAAVLNPPHLTCIVPQVSPPDAMRNIPFDHGVFFLYGNIWWAKIVSGRRSDFTSLGAPLPHPEKFATLPLSDLDMAVLGQNLEFYDRWLTRPTIKDWSGMDYTFHLSDAHVPALHISGIWDGDEIGTHINWQTMRDLRRPDQWIVFGPWVHAFNTTHSLGDVEYGPDAIIDLDSVTLRWFDHWLKGKPVRQESSPHVRLFVTGANRWAEFSDWPSPEMKHQTLYFQGDKLVESAGKAETKTYVYDPSKDTKIAPAFMGMGSATTKMGKEAMGGGLFLKSDPFEKDTAIATPMEVKLVFSTTAVDTDFFVNVVDVAPNGETRTVGQPGKIRGSYIGGMDAVRPLEPGKVYETPIIPWDFAHEFKKGHRLGIVITSSMFPLYARNLGTAEPIATATRSVPQKNTIYIGGDRPSSVSFYVLWSK